MKKGEITLAVYRWDKWTAVINDHRDDSSPTPGTEVTAVTTYIDGESREDCIIKLIRALQAILAKEAEITRQEARVDGLVTRRQKQLRALRGQERRKRIREDKQINQASEEQTI